MQAGPRFLGNRCPGWAVTWPVAWLTLVRGQNILCPVGFLLLSLVDPLLLSDLFSFRLSQGSHRSGGPGIDTVTGQ